MTDREESSAAVDVKIRKSPPNDMPEPEESQPEETSGLEESQPEETQEPEESQPEETQEPEESQPEETQEPEESRPEETQEPEESQPEETQGPEESQPDETQGPEESQPGNTLEPEESLPEGTQEPEESLPEETLSQAVKNPLDKTTEYPAFHDSAVVEGVRISIDAPEGVLPEDAFFEAVPLTDTESLEQLSGAIEDYSGMETASDLLVFDITIYDQDGYEVQPDTENGSVTVIIEDAYDKEQEEVSNSVYFVSDDRQEVEELDASFCNGNVEFEPEHFSTYVIVRRTVLPADAGSPSDWAPSITDISLIKGNSADSGTKIPEEGGILKSTDSIWIRCRFNVNLDFTNPNDVAIAKSGKTYFLMDIPETLELKDPQAWEIKAGDITLGTVTPGGDGDKKLSFTFAENLTEAAEGFTIGSVWVDYNAQLDMDQIGDKEETDIVFTTTPTTTYTVSVDDNMPKEPLVEKTGDRSGTEIKWEVTVTSQGKDYSTTPFTLKDTLGKNQSYKPGTFYYIDTYGKKQELGEGSNGLEVTRDTATNIQTLVYTNSTLPGSDFTQRDRKITFGYTTTINNSVFANDGSDKMANGERIKADITNSAQLMAGSKQIGNTATATVTVDDTQTWMAKTGERVQSGSDVGEMKWSITIYTNGYGSSFESITLHDKMESPLKLKPNTIKYQISSQPETSLDDSVFQPSGDHLLLNGEAGYEFTDLGGVDTITVTYNTAFSSAEEYTKYLKENHEAPDNSAWLDFVWKDYYGPGTGTMERGIPTLVVPSGLTHGSLAKTGSYDPSTHTITWTITVNQNEVELSNAIIKDVIGSNQTYVEGSLKDVGTASPSFSGNGTENDPFTLSLGQIDKKKEFTYQTLVTNADFYANNKTEVYTNKAMLYEGETRLAEVNPSVSCTSKVIEKKAMGYDFTNNRIKWQVVVNQNKMEMTNVSFEDQLSHGLTLCEETGAITYQAGDGSTANLPSVNSGTGYYYTYTGNLLKVFLKNMAAGDAPITITYYTDVAVDQLTDLIKKLSDVSVGNSAVLHNAQYNGPSGEAQQTIPGKCLVKTGNIPSDDKNCIEYTVKINPHRVTLPGGTYIQDALPAGLQLQIPSIGLYNAAVTAGGDLTEGEKIPFDGKLLSTSLDGDGRTTFRLTLPSGGKKAYIMKYRTSILDINQAPFSNSVVMSGMEAGQMGSHEMTKNQILQNGGGGSLQASTRIRITKTDKDDPSRVLEGAVFQLLYNGNVVGEEVTDVNGIAVFYGLSMGETYSVQEKSAPDGYYIQSNGITDLPDLKKGLNNITITNSATPPPVQEPDTDHTQNPDVGGSSGSDGSGSGSLGGGSSYGPRGPSAYVFSGSSPFASPGMPAYAAPGPAGALSLEPGGSFVLPQTGEVISGERIMEEVASAMEIPDQQLPASDAEALRLKLAAITEQDPHFFDEAPAEMQRFVADLLAPALLPLPKTGDTREIFTYLAGALMVLMIILWGIEKNRSARSSS